MFEELPVGWTAFPVPPEARSQGASAWAEERLLVWGGHVYTGYSDEVPRADGFTFDARSRTWHAMAAAPLAPRLMPASAWSGRELLIWGGTDERFQRFFRDGAAYDPESDSWRRLPRAPISARAPLSVWTGRELLVWATAVRVRDRPRDGAAYDPRG
ncbi:MAG: hypothetical protein H0U82_10650, partial [Actinobacteria bacterium]|nr:hypothetical protein [Actinomycetota bacterium]